MGLIIYLFLKLVKLSRSCDHYSKSSHQKSQENKCLGVDVMKAGLIHFEIKRGIPLIVRICCSILLPPCLSIAALFINRIYDQ